MTHRKRRDTPHIRLDKLSFDLSGARLWRATWKGCSAFGASPFAAYWRLIHFIHIIKGVWYGPK